ncbi:hypothetical protein BOTBODRAFT_37697 [Botryobasidium botryosum FD-172 SS1]|uniref:Uncharacterized protein n=1 Tax=Botryobasidium botryosum (strain FD-172 SS1) TaxID=930990 RepID=A0A067MAR5_BOTB1|nr:hypothetical protein BOTBODRAFT_37697 [Botryobasidium botryosum FD-172 SS1]
MQSRSSGPIFSTLLQAASSDRIPSRLPAQRFQRSMVENVSSSERVLWIRESSHACMLPPEEYCHQARAPWEPDAIQRAFRSFLPEGRLELRMTRPSRASVANVRRRTDPGWEQGVWRCTRGMWKSVVNRRLELARGPARMVSRPGAAGEKELEREAGVRTWVVNQGFDHGFARDG